MLVLRQNSVSYNDCFLVPLITTDGSDAALARKMFPNGEAKINTRFSGVANGHLSSRGPWL